MDKYCALALRIQDASNVGAVLTELRDMIIEMRNSGIDYRNHPATVLLLDKVLDLLDVPLVYDRLTAYREALSQAERSM